MVIQRIQSVYLLIVAILMAVYSFMNVVLVLTTSGVMSKMTLFDASPIAFIISLLVACLAFITIFKYKKLNLQIALSSCGIILLITDIVVLVMSVINAGYVTVEFFICNCMPIIALVFLFLTISAIKRDKKILSSYDRIR